LPDKPTVTNFREILLLLERGGVQFVVIGGVAATVHGASRLTRDIDVVYARDRENIRKLAAAFASRGPYLRGAPPGLPFRFDEKTIALGLNFTLTTDLGDVDLLGEIAGGGRFEDLLPHSALVSIYGVSCLCVDLPTLIRSKRAAGRPKDLEAIAELEALLAERERENARGD
jgi:predicted nucleotidyltransferase